MSGRRLVPVLDFVAVDAGAAAPLYHQIYLELRGGILRGRLAAGTRLPSTRDAAAALAVSRRPVREAYDFLLAEGLLESRRGSGTFVARRPPSGPAPVEPDHAVGRARPALSRRGRALAETGNFETRSTGAFAPTLPADDQFPRRVFARLLARRWRAAAAGDFRKPPAGGLPELREAIASYLATARGLVCAPEQVLITAGSTHATGMLARLLLDPG